ncbi:hypothetical protein ACOMHN_055670 [Nucella lapillus]
MASRPTVKEGTGEKSQFKEMKLELRSHKAAEFDADDNIFKIELFCPNSVKTIYNLFHYDTSGKEEDVKTGVLIQSKDHKIKFHVAVSEPGWYKLNIFAAPLSSDNSSIPCVYTYLFYLKNVREIAYPYPKQFADWKEGCYLSKPKFLNPSSDLNKVKFKVDVPGANRVAVKAGDEWTHLERVAPDSTEWSGDVCLAHHIKNKDKINLNACTGSDETSFATLLQYE